MLNDIRQACRVDHKDFDLALIKNDNFLNFETSGIPAELRKKILDTIGLYGIYIVRDAVYANPDVSLQEVRDILLRESGADAFVKTIYNHFGLRSELIKSRV